MQSEIKLPNVRAATAASKDDKLWYKLLVTLRGASDKAGDSALRLLADAHIMACKGGRGGYRTVKSAYNNPNLAGGGYRKIKAKIHKQLAYCVNPRIQHGKLACQRLLPDGHTGPCPWCQHPTEFSINGKSTYLSVDHVIHLAPYYKILMASTDLAQKICDYYPTSIKRLSTPLSDVSARVYCTESGYIARR